MTSSRVAHTQKSELKADHYSRVRNEMAPVSECKRRIVWWRVIKSYAPRPGARTADCQCVITRHTPAILALTAARADTIATICNHGKAVIVRSLYPPRRES